MKKLRQIKFTNWRCFTKENNKSIFILLAILIPCNLLFAQQWQAFKGKDNLTSLFSNTTVTLNKERGEYCSNGTGILYAYGTTFLRTWSVKNEREVCISSEAGGECYTFEQSKVDGSLFRVTNSTTNNREVVRVMPGGCDHDMKEGPLFQDWRLITVESELQEFFNNKVYEWENGRVEFCAGGSGTVFAYNSEFPRTWVVKDNGFCITSLNQTICYSLEKHLSNPELFREKNLTTGKYAIVRLSSKKAISCQD